MTETEYLVPCRNVSLSLGMEDVDALGETGHLEIDGVEFAIHFVADRAPDTIFCYVKLGAVPQHERATVYESLLRMNMLSGTKTVGVVALETEGDDAVFVAHVETGGRRVEPKALAGRLRVYAKQAVDMRGTVLAGAHPSRGSRRDRIRPARRLAPRREGAVRADGLPMDEARRPARIHAAG